ncbi:MAG TPA: hypothetical protein VJJ21_04370 [Candidatus Nanoarchaeia archaeon]|nr:hypothetical protein [Candidatus Nanoarchaeia archaeon]
MLRRAKDKLGRRWFFIIFFLIILIAVFFITKAYLYVNFILGNDTVVKLSSNTNFISLQHNQNAAVNYEASVTANPFCKIRCRSEFEDLSNSNLLDTSEFMIRSGSPVTLKYAITAPEKGLGDKLYRFNLKCSSESTLLCQTGGNEATRSQLLILEYNDTAEEKEAHYQLIQKVNWSLQYLNVLELSVKESKKISEELNKHVFAGYLLNRTQSLETQIVNSRVEFLTLVSPDNRKPPLELLKSYQEKNITMYKIIEDSDNLIFAVEGNATHYHNLLFDLREAREQLLVMNSSNQTDLESAIFRFNNITQSLNNQQSFEELESRIALLQKEIQEIKPGNQTTNQSISQILQERIAIGPISYLPIEILFQEKTRECNLLNKKQECCLGDNCNENYPVIIIHGHAISDSATAEYSLEGFNLLQDALEKDGYINGGTTTVYTEEDTPEGRLGYFNVPFSFRTSYYFDVFKEPDNYKVVQTKSENIDTYAVRLKDIISTVKSQTGKPKVKIIAFSMGGLVTRRYLQIFGSNDVDRVILLGVPNKGIQGESLTICPLIGGKLECQDMDKNSLFINKLNDNKKYNIPVYNILGTGCSMLDGQGDGAVLEDNAKLETATANYIVKGTCRSKFYPLHLDLLNPGMYPEAYQRIRSSLG